MKGNHDQGQRPLSSAIVDDKAAESLKKRLRDWGLIVNAGGGKPARPTGEKKGGRK